MMFSTSTANGVVINLTDSRSTRRPPQHDAVSIAWGAQRTPRVLQNHEPPSLPSINTLIRGKIPNSLLLLLAHAVVPHAVNKRDARFKVQILGVGSRVFLMP